MKKLLVAILFSLLVTPTVAFTVGYTTTPTANSSSRVSGQVCVNGTYTMPQDGILQSVSIYLAAAQTSGNGLLGVYSDNAGTPNSLLATTATYTMAAGWNTVSTTTNPTITSGTKIWIAGVGVGHAMVIEYDAAGGTFKYDTCACSTLPATFTVTATNANISFGYATFNPPNSSQPLTLQGVGN
jgi:hypothetical protein